jgi:hypothetical protein
MAYPKGVKKKLRGKLPLEAKRGGSEGGRRAERRKGGRKEGRKGDLYAGNWAFFSQRMYKGVIRLFSPETKWLQPTLLPLQAAYGREGATHARLRRHCRTEARSLMRADGRITKPHSHTADSCVSIFFSQSDKYHRRLNSSNQKASCR